LTPGSAGAALTVDYIFQLAGLVDTMLFFLTRPRLFTFVKADYEDDEEEEPQEKSYGPPSPLSVATATEALPPSEGLRNRENII
jgi:hypothetical protein